MGVLRFRDGRTGSYVELAARRSIPLRLCVHGPSAGVGYGLADVRVLLVADVLIRIAELGGLQVVAVLTAASLPAGVLERSAAALGINPPAACASFEEAGALLGGPADVHVAGATGGVGDRAGGVLITIGPVDDLTRGSAPDPGATGGHGRDPLALRLAMLCCSYHQPVELTEIALAEAGEALRRWRHSVAEWACEPSRPVPAETAREIAAAFDDDLNTAAALAILRGMESDPGVPAGAKFETFAFADRVLGLELVSEIGHLR
jgi:hypothetical protein